MIWEAYLSLLVASQLRTRNWTLIGLRHTPVLTIWSAAAGVFMPSWADTVWELGPPSVCSNLAYRCGRLQVLASLSQVRPQALHAWRAGATAAAAAAAAAADDDAGGLWRSGVRFAVFIQACRVTCSGVRLFLTDGSSRSIFCIARDVGTLISQVKKYGWFSFLSRIPYMIWTTTNRLTCA